MPRATSPRGSCCRATEAELEREGFGLLLAVGRGSDEPSRLIHLIYRGAGPITRRLALVGKGVTFDSGGYSLKPREAITGMHLDMGGAAAVLGAADAIGRLKPAGVEVHFVVPSVENMVNGKAYKLNEVFKGYGGQTVEILNTDAEGRLILADAISYIAGFKPDEIIDLATLTGACVVALGLETAGLFASDDEVAQRLLAAAARADESIWRMPLTERIEDQLKSDVADMKNIGSRWGGAISAALFLKRFVTPGTPWMHLDIAGPAMAEAEWEYINRGGTGFGVATLVEYVEGLSRG
jgi:leucyl aminopeptidase